MPGRVLTPEELAGAEVLPDPAAPPPVDMGPGARRALSGMAPASAGMTDPNPEVAPAVDPAAARHAEGQAIVDDTFARWGVPGAVANVQARKPAPTLRSLIVGSAAAPPGPRKLAPDELAGALDQAPPEPAADQGAVDAFTRNATNILGLAPTYQAAASMAEDAFRRHVLGENRPKYSYDEWRKFYANMLDASREQHPIAAGAGQLAEGVTTAVLAPEVKLAEGASPFVRNAVNAGVQSAAGGAGEAISHGKSAGEVARAAATAGATGALVGGTLGTVAEKFVKNAPAQADNWILKDVIGAERKSGSTPTTRKQLTQDKADVIDVIKHDPELDSLIAKAEGGDTEHIGAAAAHVDKRLDQVFAPRKGMYNEVDRLTGGGVRVGDVVDRVEGRIKELGETVGHKNERQALRGVVDDIKETLGGGRRVVVDPEADIVPGFKASKAYEIKQRELANAKTPEAKAAAQADLDALASSHGKVADYDPNRIVPTVTLRDGVTRMQKDVANAMGALNEKVSYQRTREMLRPVEDVLDSHLAKVQAKNPMLFDAIKEMNRQGSALMNVQKVLEERALRGEQNALTGKAAKLFKAAHGASFTGATVAAATGHYKTAAALAATAAAPIVKRGADRAMAAIVRKAAQGPLTAAELNAARAAGVSDMILARLKRGAGRAGAQAVKAGVEKTAPRVLSRFAGSRANSMVNDFLDDRTE